MNNTNFVVLLFAITLFPTISIDSTNTTSSYKYALAICAIFQNEARFMKEWIEFHKLVGAQHFYLYNNFSTDEYLDVLAPYIQKKEVELIDWPHLSSPGPGQIEAYQDALKRTCGLVKWLAIIDLDEYLFPVKEDNLLDFLQNYEEFGGVCANWVMFGTSRVGKIPAGDLRIRNLTWCDPRGHRLVKSIVRPDRVKEINHPHYAIYKDGFWQATPDKIKFDPEMPSQNISLDKLRINHYFVGDAFYFLNVKLPRQIKRLADKDDYLKQLEIVASWSQYATNINILEDHSIYKYIDNLQKILNQYN